MQESELFLQALEIPDPEVRAAFLERACIDNPDHRRKLEQLLRAHEEAGTFLETPHPAAKALEHTSPFVSHSSPTESAGMVIAGKYKLLQHIGEGGMGSVWMADQLEPVKRRVAVKLIRSERDGSRNILSRFDAERQAIALMDHPHIAKLLDAGTIDGESTGRPFFAMELVKGIPLTQFCDKEKLSINDRLQLFIHICSAVQHAHQKGIIHRDLKPTNILVESVDGKPVPRVIDFGLAKALSGQPLTEETLFTGFGAVAGTPLYMAPEQAKLNAVDIDTRADIYSLGVILYELLAGSTPIERERLKNAPLDEMLRMIRESEPPTPSKRLSTTDSNPSIAANRQVQPLKLSRILRGELDWIVMKALSKERDRRYETATGFARDIERFLNHEPVQAGPPGVGYKLKKFVRRNRLQVIAASLLLLAVLVGTAGTTFGLIRAENRRLDAEQSQLKEARQRGIAEFNEAKAISAANAEAEERKRAEQARDRTREALDAMTSTVTGDSLATQQELSGEQKRFLSQVLTYYKDFAGEQADDQKSQARTALAAFRVGLIEYQLGRTAESETAFLQARDGFIKLAAGFSTEPEYRKRLAESYANLGVLLHAGKRPEAEDMFLRALGIAEILVAEFPTQSLYRQMLALIHNSLGLLVRDRGKQTEAMEHYRKAMEIEEILVTGYSGVPEYRQDLARTHQHLGLLLRDVGKWLEAEDHFRKAVAIQEKLAAESRNMSAYSQSLAVTHHDLGLMLMDVGKWLEAEDHFRKAVAIQEKLVDQYPNAPIYRQELAASLNNFRSLLWDLGKRTETGQQDRNALRINEKLVAEFYAISKYREHLAASHGFLGRSFISAGKRVEAEEQYLKALEICEDLVARFPLVAAHSKELATFNSDLGIVQSQLGKRQDAEERLRTALKIREKLAAEFPAVLTSHQELAEIHNNLGLFLSARGQWKEAEEHYRKSISILEKLSADSPNVPAYRGELATCHNNLGLMLDGLGERTQAKEHCRKALAIQEKLTAEFPFIAKYAQGLSGTHNNLGKLLIGLLEVEEHYRKALAINEKLLAEFPAIAEYRQDLAVSHNNLGLQLAGVGKGPEAEGHYRKALVVREKLVSEFPEVSAYRRELAITHNTLGNLLVILARRQEAEEQYRKALAIREKLVADFTDMPQYRVDLGGSCCNFGNLLSQTGHADESLAWYEKAIQALTPLYEQDHRVNETKTYLRNSYGGRAMAYNLLRKHDEAIRDWDKVVELSENQQKPLFRTFRANSRIKAGQVAEAVAEVAELVKLSGWNSNQWYDFACVYAVAGNKDADKKQEYGDRAMELLDKAVKAGYKDAAHLGKDTDLDPLRHREDFKKLVESLGKTQTPKKQ